MGKVLNKIIHRKTKNVQSFKTIEMGDSVSRYLTNPRRIDYLEVKLKEGSYLFSKNGGHDLIEYQAIVQRIDKLISTKSFHSIDDGVIVELDGDDLSMKLCSDFANEKICSPETKIPMI